MAILGTLANSAALEEPEEPARQHSGAGFLSHIQGLRAVAVGLVVATHLTGWPTGGFIGVDVFFVISGFLITGLLVRERERTGSVTLREFYARRMRRIFPMAVVVLLATVAVAFALFAQKRADATAVDAFWALVSLENWHLAQQGTDYFHATDAVSPVQQYWSLSVEEQFYLVWPVLLIGLTSFGAWRARVAARRGRARHGEASDRWRRPLIWALALVVAGSFGWAVWQSATAPTVAYFSTLTRAWELAVGALLAVALASGVRLLPRLRGLLLGASLLVIVWSAWWITSATSFPGPWAAMPVLATGVALVVGHGATGLSARLLASAPFQFVGKISYSLYLWHFPVFVFWFTLVDRTPASMAAALGAAMGLSVASFYLIEEPIRRSRWLSKRSGGPADLPPRRSAWSVVGLVGRWTVLTSAAVALLLVAAVGLYPRLIPTPPVKAATLESNGTGALAGLTIDPATVLRSSLLDAVNATAWPVLREEDGWEDLRTVVSGPECTDGPARSSVCTYPTQGATKTAVLIGDSQAHAWSTGVRAALSQAGYNVVMRQMPGCPLADAPVYEFMSDKVEHTACPPYIAESMNFIRDTKPDLVIASTLWLEYRMVPGYAQGDPPSAEWQAAIMRNVDRLAALTPRLVLLDSPPEGKSIAACQTPSSVPDDCETMVTQEYRHVTQMNEAVAAKAQADGRDVRHVGVEQWFCYEGVCPSFIAAHPIYADAIHVAPVYGEYVAPLLRSAMLA
ncbi:MAG: hypothetical protein RLZ55_1431 [Actinomycetota bacterium]|jgi:peptidoglycan/LPS O-acetylase OafA/YrhL